MNLKTLVSMIMRSPRESHEITPGVFEERRYFLWLSAGLLTPLLIGITEESGLAKSNGSQMAGAPAGGLTEFKQLNFADFSEQCDRLAKQAVQDPNLNQDAHTAHISSLASRLDLTVIPKGKLFPYGKWDPPVELGPIHLAPPLSIIQWRMAPNAVFPPHNHQPANVVSLGVEGEARVRHFDIAGDAPDYASKKSFLIRETNNVLLTPGKMSSLTMKRDNIHTFKAGKEGALGIDINTILPGDKPFSFLSFDAKPRDVAARTYEAVWTSMPS